jgi:hypothetical protein
MRQVRDVLRLKQACGMSERVIAEALGLGRTTVGDYLRRARVAGLDWPLPAGLSDVELERPLFPGEASRAPHRPPPDWLGPCRAEATGVTLRLLWEEYLSMDDLREHKKEALRMAALHRLLLAALPTHNP